MTAREEFKSIVAANIHREGIDKLMSWLEQTDFFMAPASTRFHGNYPGGLAEHSVNVYRELKRLLAAYPEIQASEETIAIAALFHDLCKANTYKSEKRNRKNEQGQWESYDAYTFEEQFCYGGHGSKSVFLANWFMHLTKEEAVAINCHMSSWDGNKEIGKAYEQCPFAWLLHVADESASYIVEAKKTIQPNFGGQEHA